jgi:AraC-like DNA-binding protein
MARAASDDMTSSALVALMETSFRRQRLTVVYQRIRKDGAHASLGDKVAVAEAVLAQHGPGPLLRVGASINDMARDPLAAALLSARSGPDLFARWQRLERYVHTRHPILMRNVTDNAATLDHRGDPNDPPSIAINYILAGLFANLLAAIGCRDVALTLGPERQVVPLHPKALDCDMGQIAPNLDRPSPDAAASDNAGRYISRRLSKLIQDDLLQTWTLAQAATTLAVSQRTLQRRLRDEGLTLTALRRRAQIEMASRHLLAGQASLSSTGFACGFSDLPHLTREFRKHVGMPPSAFRAVSSERGK